MIINNILLTSRSIDTYIYKTWEKVKKKWWPWYFIESVFKDHSLIYTNITPENNFDVNIFIENKWERWVIIWGKFKTINNITTENLIISWIYNEFLIKDLSNYYCKNLFIDIQSFNRIYKNISKKEFIISSNCNLFLKAADYEIEKFDKELLNYIKKEHTLILTKWSKWGIVYDKWSKFKYKSKNIKNLKDTVWAWDTFFANFIVSYLDNNDINKSIKFAANSVYNFLLLKKQNDKN